MDKNFAGQNLNGRSFRGQDLRGADFSGCQLKGCDFSEADLTGAKLCRTVMGINYQRVMLKLLLGSIIAVFGGIASFSLNFFIVDYFEQYNQDSFGKDNRIYFNHLTFGLLYAACTFLSIYLSVKSKNWKIILLGS